MDKKKWYILSIALLVIVMSVVVTLLNREGNNSSKHSDQKTATEGEIQEEVDGADQEQIDSNQGTLNDDEQTAFEQMTELPIIVMPNSEDNMGQDKENQTPSEEQEDSTVETTGDQTMELPFVPAE